MFRALIVDDHPLFRSTLRQALGGCFPDSVIDEAEDGPSALEKIEHVQPDLVLLDIHMPGENGLEITRKIRRDHPAVRVVILTSYDLPEYREAAQRHGAHGFLSKSASGIQEIVEAVRALLDSARA